MFDIMIPFYSLEDKKSVPEDQLCAICQDKRLHPVTLPCEHTFCYLCIKGVFVRQGVCALCRQPIPSDAITHPKAPSTLVSQDTETSPQWVYEAKGGGWWLYEERISSELEKSYQSSATEIQIQISGFMYVINFQRMVQYRREKPDRVRRIQRGNEHIKGVAGIPFAPSTRTDNSREDHHVQ